MSTVLASVLLASGVMLLPVQAAPAQATSTKAHIDGLKVHRDAGQALFTFRLADGLTGERLNRLHSGLGLAFKYRLEVLGKRPFPLMPHKLLARMNIHTSVEFDLLTKQYTVQRRLEIKSKRKRDAIAPDEQRLVTGLIDEMESWMTAFEEIPVFDPAQPLAAGRLRVRVNSTLGRRYALLIFPTTIKAAGESWMEP